MAHVGPAVHAPVRNQYKTLQVKHVHSIFHCRPQRQMIQRIPRKHFNGNRNAIVVQKQSHLHNGLFAIFLGYPHFSQALLNHVVLLIQKIVVRFLHLKEKVRYIIEYCTGFPSDLSAYAGIHSTHDLFAVLVYHVQNVIYVICVVALYQRIIVFFVLPHRGNLGGWLQYPSIGQQSHDPLQIILDLRTMLDTGKQLIQTQCRKNSIQKASCKALGTGNTIWAALFNFKSHLHLRRFLYIWQQLRNKRLPFGKRLAQACHILWLAIVILCERAKSLDYFFAIDAFAFCILYAVCPD